MVKQLVNGEWKLISGDAVGDVLPKIPNEEGEYVLTAIRTSEGTTLTWEIKE